MCIEICRGLNPFNHFANILLLIGGMQSAVLAEAPDWQVNPSQFEFSATLTAVLLVNGEVAAGEGNLLAAFVDGELRGAATPIQALDTWIYFLTVYANTTSEVISFQAYVAAADVVTEVEGSINFQANQIYGEPDNPVILQATVAEDAFTDVDEFETENLPPSFVLYPNYPNPFNATTRLEYQVAIAGKVEIVVYNLLGQPVRVLVDGMQAMGRQTIDWDGLDSAGEAVPGGVYIYRMRAGEFAALRKMTVLK